MNKTNLLIIINSFGFGGNETAALQLISNIDKCQFNCYILVIDNISGPMSEIFTKQCIPILNLNNKNLLTFNFIKSYYKLLKEYRINTTISYVYNYQIVLLQFIGLISGVKKRIIRVSAMPLKKSLTIKLFFIQLLSNLFITNQIAVSHSVKIWLNKIGGYYKKKIIVICNGIQNNLVNHYNNYNELFNVVMVARMDSAKDYYTLIEAISIVQNSNPHINLLLIGDGPERQKLELFSKKMMCKVKFLGFSKFVNDILKSSSIFVHSSFSEGFPNVILEAMTNGLPIIASDIPPNREILNNGEYGFLFEIQNSDQLASLILKLAENDYLRQTFSEKSFQRSFHYSLNEMVLNYQKILGLN